MLQFLRDLFDPLFNLMGFTLQTFHGWGAPWWLAIAMLTVVVRTFLFPLTIRQVKSMRKMQDLKPAMDELRKEHKDDPQMLQQEMVKLYRERGANPLGGCLPIFVQLPIFLVLFYTIKEFEKLESFRNGGLFWFQDLTVHDPLYILPVLYIATMMVSQEIAMKNTAPEQKRIMRFLPLVFGIVLLRFPAGLFVYWVTSNVISIVQNLLIYRNAPKPGVEEDEPETGEADSPEDDGHRAEMEGDAVPLDRPTPNGSGGQQSETGQRRRARRRR
ncbi:MAG TPA: YidC/Oxa1 family membrane protein insertase [Rubrobacter sp.]|nr:YidC/Oxa1 family membrane protein insertase [Rubrobacter sp.]